MNGTIDAHVSKSTGNVVTVRNIALGNYALSPLTGLPVNLNKFEFLRLPCRHSIFATFYGIAAPQGGQIILSYKSRTMKLVDSHSLAQQFNRPDACNYGRLVSRAYS